MERAPRKGEDPAARYLTTREAAERLGVSINALKTWIREQRLPALRTPGGHHRISVSDLAVFQASLTENSRIPASSQRRILVVDDDEALLAAVKDTLEEIIPESAIETATDGYEALVQVGSFRPDVLVLDIRMPRLDGFEVCRRLKKRRETSAIRILAVTAFPEREVRDKALECGADDVLEKPFGIQKFRSRVMALLERPAARS
jgi:excisionase family DNA binding protein